MNLIEDRPQRSLPAGLDLREMLRDDLVRRALARVEQAAVRRREVVRSGDFVGYRAEVRAAMRSFYGELPVGRAASPPKARVVSVHHEVGFRVENVVFESLPGWEVNASVFVPEGKPPFPAVVVPVGHAGKQMPNYQLPCQALARSGWLAVVFDPPGMAGEKQLGNDHFRDGVRCYPSGLTSSLPFVADALRCIDYLETRPDADLSRGCAMTGVSGGGHTSVFCGLLDERVTSVAPSCCFTPSAAMDLLQGYAQCPETNMAGRLAAGLDNHDFICGLAPTPLLLLIGRHDEIFRIGDVEELGREAAAFYGAQKAGGVFEFFVSECGHAYDLPQVRRFLAFQDRLRGTDHASRFDALPLGDLALLPADRLRCHPRTDVNLRSLSRDAAARAKAKRNATPRKIIPHLAAIHDLPASPTHEVIVGTPFRLWRHEWLTVRIDPSPGIVVPATLLRHRDDETASLLVHFDDGGRHRLLESGGLLASAVGFNDRRPPLAHLLTADLRGWGDSAPAVHPYEITGWGSRDRYVAYLAAALGESIPSRQLGDALAVLAAARATLAPRASRVVISGCGLGGLVAAHAAALCPQVSALVVWDALWSVQSLVDEDDWAWPDQAFIPHLLRHYDLPELLAELTCPVHVVRPLDACRAPLPTKDIIITGQVQLHASCDDLAGLLRNVLAGV